MTDKKTDDWVERSEREQAEIDRAYGSIVMSVMVTIIAFALFMIVAMLIERQQ